MKKTVSALLFLLLLALVPVGGALAMSTRYVYTENGLKLNLRSAPSTDAEVVARIPYGTAVLVDETGVVGDNAIGRAWMQVYYNDIMGYCMEYFLSETQPEPTATPTPAPETDTTIYDGFTACYYTATVQPSYAGGFVHLRWAPAKSQPIQQDYYAGNVLTVIAQNGEWSQVIDETDHISGFMMSYFLLQMQ